jgi:hypothetical protein
MLLLADRGFFSFALWGKAAETAPTGLAHVQDKLPQRLRGPVGKKMRAAYHADSALLAEAQLQALARELDKTQPRVAATLREGLAETLSVCCGLGCHPRWHAR